MLVLVLVDIQTIPPPTPQHPTQHTNHTTASEAVVETRKEKAAAAEEGLSFMYYVNDGVYGSFNCLLFDHAQAFPKVLSARGRPVRHQKDTVWTCVYVIYVCVFVCV